MTSLSLASVGLLDRGSKPALDIAALGYLRLVSVAPPVVVEIDNDAGYADPRRVLKQQQDARDRHRRDRDDLRRIIARAVEGEPPTQQPVALAPPLAVLPPAPAVQQMLRLDGVVASLDAIEKILADMERARVAAQMEEEDVEAILLAA